MRETKNVTGKCDRSHHSAFTRQNRGQLCSALWPCWQELRESDKIIPNWVVLEKLHQEVTQGFHRNQGNIRFSSRDGFQFQEARVSLRCVVAPCSSESLELGSLDSGQEPFLPVSRSGAGPPALCMAPRHWWLLASSGDSCGLPLWVRGTFSCRGHSKQTASLARHD